ncbi:MAG: hypothetical protein MI862_05370 [Desulfobacterales bacterium]|nr:hypothetical protein [Desulfobacterales bacterium]
MEMSNRATLALTYNNRDISAQVASQVLSFSYVDHDGGKADDINVRLEDSQGLWMNAWFPDKGAILTAGIRTDYTGRKRSLDCGTFAVDEIRPQGPPDIMTIKAVSSFTAKALKREKKTRAWEKVSLKDVAAKIAARHGLGFYFGVESLVSYDRLDQREESDLIFLKRLCDDRDINLKISGEKLILFESRTMEQAPPVFSCTRGKDAVGRFSFSTKAHDVYKAAQVAYWDPDKKEERIHVFTLPGMPVTGETLKINQRVESLADAQAKAQSMLRRKNREETTGTLDVMGDTRLLSGLTGTVSGFGRMDGKYIITEATHTLARTAGYRTSIKIRKVMDW